MKIAQIHPILHYSIVYAIFQVFRKKICKTLKHDKGKVAERQ